MGRPTDPNRASDCKTEQLCLSPLGPILLFFFWGQAPFLVRFGRFVLGDKGLEGQKGRKDGERRD